MIFTRFFVYILPRTFTETHSSWQPRAMTSLAIPWTSLTLISLFFCQTTLGVPRTYLITTVDEPEQPLESAIDQYEPNVQESGAYYYRQNKVIS